MVPVLAVLLLSALTVLSPPAAHPASARPTPHDPPTSWPVPGAVTAEFDPPTPDWLPGHRGLDLAAAPGEPVHSPRAGVVVFVGSVARIPVVVVAHGATRATYQPVSSDLQVGSQVALGQRIGSVAPAPVQHCPAACLHWGLKLLDHYLDPRILLGRPHIVLRPVPGSGTPGTAIH